MARNSVTVNISQPDAGGSCGSRRDGWGDGGCERIGGCSVFAWGGRTLRKAEDGGDGRPEGGGRQWTAGMGCLKWRSPQSSDHAPYPSPHFPVHQPSPYPAQPHYPPSHPLPPRPLHAPLSYSQDWGSSWTPQQNWQYQTNNNEEDWGAKAKAWLAAKAATENQNPSPQFVTGGGTEEKYQNREQYSQRSDPQTQFASASNYQQYPGAVGSTNHTGLCQLQESQDASSGQSSYGADMHVASAARDGSHAGDSITPINPLVHQQEVPSSYSSVAGNEEVGDRYEKFNSSSSLPVALLPQHVQLQPPGRDGWMEEPRTFGHVPAESPSTLRDQPLNFAPQFTRNLNPHAQPNYNYSSGAVRGGEAISSNYAWPSSTAPGAAYPLVPPSNPSVAQVDHPIAMPSPAPGHPAPMFPTGPTFQPTIPMIGAAFGGVGVAPSPTAFPVDAHGVSERPKKASVPNWLREEIIKNKAVITSSVPEIPKDDSQSIEEDSIGKSSRKGYQGDSKSIDSSRSTEDEDEDEIHQHIQTSRNSSDHSPLLHPSPPQNHQTQRSSDVCHSLANHRRSAARHRPTATLLPVTSPSRQAKIHRDAVIV
ncbi:cyclin-related family protein, partial [Striga asiatica]